MQRLTPRSQVGAAPGVEPGGPALNDATLAAWMLRRELIDQKQLDRARQRQRLYGGTLDTALLELSLTDEATVARCLAEASGLTAVPPEWLQRPVDPATLQLLDAAACRRLTAQPLGREGNRLLVAVAPGADLEAINAWAAGRGTTTRCHVLPLVRLEALWSALHGQPLPARHAALLGRLGGVERARRASLERREAGRRAAGGPRVETGPAPDRPRPPPAAARGAQAPAHADDLDLVMEVEEPADERPGAAAAAEPPAGSAPAVTAPPEPPTPGPEAVTPPPEPIDTLELLLDALQGASDGEAGSKEHRALWRRLRPFAADPRADRLLAIWRARASEPGEPGRQAMAVLGEVADPASVAALLEHLGSDDKHVRTAALAALRTATCHDFGPMRWRWNRWWGQFSERHRVEWLLDALDGRDAGLRLAAARELEQLSGRYVGYHFDLGKRDRDEARRRWQEWWDSTGKGGEARE